MYKVSVVTPFHNVDMAMFQKAADSMRQQTIGFENIEWVIVVHNCEPQYLPQLQEMFKDDKNVTVKELNNEAKTPSSPRNYSGGWGADKTPNNLKYEKHTGGTASPRGRVVPDETLAFLKSTYRSCTT